MSRLSLLVPLTALTVLAGCPGSLEDPGRFADQFGGGCPDVPALLQSACASAGCHSASDAVGSLDLASPMVFGRLSGKMAAGGAGLLIDPDEPDASVLYAKLTAAPPFGSRMPLSAEALDDATAACVLAWIDGESP